MIDTRIDKVKSLTASDLGQRETATFISQLADEYMNSYMVGEARHLRALLNTLMKDANLQEGTEIYEMYDEALIKLSWMAVPMLSEKETEELFAKHILPVIDIEDFDLSEKAIGFMQYVFGDDSAAQKRRNALLAALKENEEQIGTQNIEDAGESMKPTIQNWLKLYDQSTRLEQRLERLPLLEFISSNRFASSLSEEDQLRLRQVLTIYDTIRFLIKNPDVAGTGHAIPRGSIEAPATEIPEAKPVVQDVAPAEGTAAASPQVNQEVLQAYQGDPKQIKAIAKEQEKIQNKFGSDSGRLRAEFFAAVQKQNANRAIALIRILAQQGDLEDFMQTDEKLHPFLRGIWEKRYGADMAKQFDENASTPEFVKLFLKYILQERLGMAESDAARIGLQIGNIFVSNGKKSYNKMAYFDVATKAFHWFE